VEMQEETPPELPGHAADGWKVSVTRRRDSQD
jgi:hypothetical protein